MYKQVIVIRGDLKLSKGKLAAQCCHASLLAVEKSDKRILNKWKNEGQKKVVLKAKNLKELLELKERCNRLKVPSALISDAGLTELKSGTITCLGIGPEEESKINKITGSLPLLR